MNRDEHKKIIEETRKTKAKALEIAGQLQQSLVTIEEDDNPKDILRHQMGLLHQITNRMLADADNHFVKMHQYNLALRAQNQYRQTLLALEALEKQGRKNL